MHGSQTWKVGSVVVTSVVEDQTEHIPPQLFFPEATTEAVSRHSSWLVPDFADEAGNVSLRVQAFVLDVGSRRIVIDPCVGNGKKRAMPFWHEQQYPFLERFAEAGFTVESVGEVLHTHLHSDHIGWDTQLVGGAWVPTFVNARHLYNEAELAFCREDPGPDGAQPYVDSVAPILDAGLADIIEPDADLGDGLQLEPTPGHTPGHVSLWIESEGERALITGDILHHPVQMAEPQWAEIGDSDAALARETRRRMFARAAESGALVIGTHFGTRPAGHVVAEGDAWRFVPVA